MNVQRTARFTSKYLCRSFATTTTRGTSWSPQPSPPRLDKEEQEIFEKLQRESTGAFSTPRRPPQVNQSPQSNEEAVVENDQTSTSQEKTNVQSTLEAKVKSGDELHPNVRRGAPPEFEGEVNPKTGEVGGPKNDPIRWGSTDNRGDWSYNGRVTDF